MEKENELAERISRLEDRLEALEKGKSQKEKSLAEANEMKVGMLSYRGKYSSPDGQIKSTFAGDVSIQKIFRTNSKDLAQVIDAFSSEDRIDIVKLLVKKPLTAKEIMEILNFPTTGKVYHHLSFLEKLGIIKKFNDKFLISARYVECVLFVMLGVAQILKEGEE